MPTSNTPPNWPTQRHYLTEALKHLSAFTDNLQTFLELADEAEAHDAGQVLTLDFGTTSVVAVMDDLGFDPLPETNMAKQPKYRNADVPRRNRTWTAKEEHDIVNGLRWGVDPDRIAEELGRSGQAVRTKMKRLRQEGRL